MYKTCFLAVVLVYGCRSAKQDSQQPTRLSLREDGFYYRQHGSRDNVEFLKFFENGRVLDNRRIVQDYVYKSYPGPTNCWLQDTTGDTRVSRSLFSHFNGAYLSDTPEMIQWVKNIEDATPPRKDYNFMMCSYRIKKDSLFFKAGKNNDEFIPYAVSFACKIVKDSLICKMTAVDYDTVEYNMPVTAKTVTFVFKQAACDSSVQVPRPMRRSEGDEKLVNAFPVFYMLD